MVRVSCASNCAARAFAWDGSGYTWPCAAGVCTRCNIKPLPRARPTRPTAYAAPQTGCSTSPNRPKLIVSGSVTSPTRPGQWKMGLPLRFSGHGQQAGRRLAGRGHHALRVKLLTQVISQLQQVNVVGRYVVLKQAHGSLLLHPHHTQYLIQALLAQRAALGLIMHSDRGEQYVGNTYKT